VRAESAQALGRVRARVRAPSWVDAAVVGIPGAALLVTAARRFVDGDEGAYLGAASLMVEHGRLPYADFLYTQTPLLPYVYGVWAAMTGESWYAVRLLSVLFAVALGWLLFRHLEERFGRRLAALGLTLYAGSELVLVWYVTVKTYALGTLLVFGAYLLAFRAGRSWHAWAGAGALLGLAIDVRLILAVAVPAVAWCALRPEVRRGGRTLTALAGGLLIGLLPTLGFLAVDYDRFLFDNLWYHASRSPDGLVGDFEQKAATAASLLGVSTGSRGYPQFLLLVIAAAGAVVALRAVGQPVSPAVLVAACLGIASFAPTPTYAQYFSVAVPFLVIAGVELVAVLSQTLRDGESRRLLTSLGAVALATYLALGVLEVARVLRASPEDRPSVVSNVAAFVDARTEPGEEVLAAWPGYLFGTGAVPVPGLENDFAPHEAAELSPEEVEHYRLATVEEVEGMIRERRTRTIVTTPWNNILPPVPAYERMARESGYRLIAEIGRVRVYGLPEDG
jgi:hypothetical protein